MAITLWISSCEIGLQASKLTFIALIKNQFPKSNKSTIDHYNKEDTYKRKGMSSFF